MEKNMDRQREVLSLRIIAARFISVNEKDGLAELNRITADASRVIQWKYGRLWLALVLTLFATVATLLPGIGFALAGDKTGAALAVVGLIPFGLLMGVLGYWRILQYGSMRATEPQVGIYADANDPAVLNLERLFALLQLETTRRAFYVTKNGARREVDERYFFGSLRAAYVAKESPIRDALFAPIGFWFSHEIFMEVDVAALIAEAKAKPNQAGAKRTYDYADAIMSLIEHPDIRNMEFGKRGNQTKIIGLLEASYITRRKTPPSENQLAGYAKLILETIAKNRSAKP
jgi:hypothetical protein